MIPATHPLGRVKRELEEIATNADVQRLAELLHGERLPSLGGHEEPAELIHRAITLQPYRPELAIELSPVLGKLLEERTGALRPSDLRNVLLLAELLPRSEAIFEGVLAAHAALPGYAENLDRPEDGQELGARLREALRWQQTDDRLESFWLGLLESPKKVDLLDGFQGVLWIPSTPEESDGAKVARLERGLNAFAVGATKRADREVLLRWAVRTLDEAYPRSSAYWQQHLAPLAVRWPEELGLAFKERWPGFEAPVSKTEPEAPEDDLRLSLLATVNNSATYISAGIDKFWLGEGAQSKQFGVLNSVASSAENSWHFRCFFEGHGIIGRDANFGAGNISLDRARSQMDLWQVQRSTRPLVFLDCCQSVGPAGLLDSCLLSPALPEKRARSWQRYSYSWQRYSYSMEINELVAGHDFFVLILGFGSRIQGSLQWLAIREMPHSRSHGELVSYAQELPNLLIFDSGGGSASIIGEGLDAKVIPVQHSFDYPPEHYRLGCWIPWRPQEHERERLVAGEGLAPFYIRYQSVPSHSNVAFFEERFSRTSGLVGTSRVLGALARGWELEGLEESLERVSAACRFEIGWRRTLETINAPVGLLARIEAAWQEPKKAHHTNDHLERVLAWLATYRDIAADPAHLDLASNLEKSAKLAREALLSARVAPELAACIAEVVLYTCHESDPPDPDSQLLSKSTSP